MPRSLMLFVIGLFFGAGAGFLLAAANGVTLDGHDHGTHGGDGGHAGHVKAHGLLDVTGDGAAPTVRLKLHPEGPGAANLEILTENFTFAPADVNRAHAPGRGHAHIYVDGNKVGRAYGPWFHLTGLPETGEIRVTLNANSHQTLAIGQQPIAASVAIDAR